MLALFILLVGYLERDIAGHYSKEFIDYFCMERFALTTQGAILRDLHLFLEA